MDPNASVTHLSRTDVSTQSGYEPVASSIRRKPQFTYKSPSGEEFYQTDTMGSTTFAQKLPPSLSRPTPTASYLPSHVTFYNTVTHAKLKRKRYPMSPPLPLYHPLGRLALSLPPLDPATFGLPTPIRIDDAVRRSSARARRPAAKLREAEEVLLPVPTVSTIAAVAAREVKEKASPRKKRSGGGGGGGSKRKRKEPDDGDATYPAKRTRLPRGTVREAGDDESPGPAEAAAPVPEVTPTPEPIAEAEDKKPERRTTRASRDAAKRRDSSASDVTSTSASAVAAGTIETSEVKAAEPMELDKGSDVGGSRAVDGRKEEKEDGELSEESQPNP